MSFPFELLEEERWRKSLHEQVIPPITCIDDFLERDNYTLLQQMGCSFEEVLVLKQSILEKASHQLPSKRRDSSSRSNASNSLLSGFDSIFSSGLASSTPFPTFSISTRIEGFDNFFHGGLPRGQVTCLAGETGSGRTQLCLHIALAAAVSQIMNPSQGNLSNGNSNRILYIDTNGQVTARRLHSMLTNILQSQQEQQTLNNSQGSTRNQREKDEDLAEKLAAALSRIDIKCCFSLFDGLDLLTSLIDQQNHRTSNEHLPTYDLIVLDSLYHWIVPLLSDVSEKFPASGTTSTATSAATGQQSSSIAVNLHPMIAKMGLLLRVLATTQVRCTSRLASSAASPVVLVTTLSSWLLPPHNVPMSSLYRHDTVVGTSTMTTARQQPSHTGLHGYHRHLAGYWREIFDSLLVTVNATPSTSDNNSSSVSTKPTYTETSLAVRVCYRPPYFKAQPETAICTV